MSEVSTVITPAMVQDLYRKMDNKMLFISNFGTTKFNVVDDKFLEKMYKYLLKKVC